MELQRVALRNVRLGNDLRNVHHREQRRGGRSHFTGVKRAVSNETGNRAANFRIAELRFRIQQLPFCRRELPIRRLNSALLADRVQSIQMFFGDVICALGLGQRYGCGIKIFARQRALLKEVLPAVIKFLLRIQLLLRRLDIKFGFGVFFRQGCANAGAVSGFSLFDMRLCYRARQRRDRDFQALPATAPDVLFARAPHRTSLPAR